MLGLQSKPGLQATRRSSARWERDEATIYLISRGGGFFGPARRRPGAKAALRRPGRQPEIRKSCCLPTCAMGTGAASSGAAARPSARHRESDFLGRRVVTDDGRVHLAPLQLVDAAHKLDAAFDRERASAGRLRLITKRQVATHNSWTHNFEEFVAGDRGTNHLYMHPQDAARVGLADGDLADVSSEVATVRVPVRTLFELMPGRSRCPTAGDISARRGFGREPHAGREREPARRRRPGRDRADLRHGPPDRHPRRCPARRRPASDLELVGPPGSVMGPGAGRS
jgi:hypothetical protein